MNFIFLIDGRFYFLGFEKLYDPDYSYIQVAETQGDITMMPVNVRDDDSDSRCFHDICDPAFKEEMLMIFDRCDYQLLAFVEVDGVYYSKLTHTVSFLDAIKTCCDFREEDEIIVRVI